jgi:hypothetical protein
MHKLIELYLVVVLDKFSVLSAVHKSTLFALEREKERTPKRLKTRFSRRLCQKSVQSLN